MTTNAVSAEIFSSPRLAGFWQFRAEAAHYLGVFETDPDGEGRLSVARLAGGQLQGMQPFAVAGADVRAVEACVDGPELVFALEINEFETGRLARMAVSAVASGAAIPKGLQATTSVTLSPSQIAGVRLPVSQLWNVAGPLGPEAWAFSLHPVCGSPGNEAVANTADGQTALLTSSDLEQSGPVVPKLPGAASSVPQRPGLSIPNAAHPQAWWRNGQVTVAFIRSMEPFWPFWSLRRYSGKRVAVSGALVVAEGAERLVDLSRTLDIGPIEALAVAARADGSEWLFGARSAAASTELFGLRRLDGAWQLAEKWELDAPAQRISVVYADPGWHVVLGTETADGWTLRLARLAA